MPLQVGNGPVVAMSRNLPLLVTPMRSGAHWLRFMLELYSGRPGLDKVYFPELYDLPTPSSPDKEIREDVDQEVDWTHIWLHDAWPVKEIDTDENRIFLVRNPVDTIASQLKFLLGYPSDIWAYAREYGKYFKKGYMNSSLILSYDRLEANTASEFKKLCDRLSIPWNRARFDMVYLASGKDMVRARTEPANKKKQQIISMYPDAERNKTNLLKSQYRSEIEKAVCMNMSPEAWEKYVDVTTVEGDTVATE